MIRGVLLFTLVLAWESACATNEALSFRVNGQGEVEAVVVGLTGFCGQRFGGPTRVEIGTATINLNTVPGGSGGGCPEPLPPPVPYEFAVVVGFLHPRTYTVEWTTSSSCDVCPRIPFLSGTLVVPDLPVASIPTLSMWSLGVLTVLLLATGACVTFRSTAAADTRLLSRVRLWRRPGTLRR